MAVIIQFPNAKLPMPRTGRDPLLEKMEMLWYGEFYFYSTWRELIDDELYRREFAHLVKKEPE